MWWTLLRCWRPLLQLQSELWLSVGGCYLATGAVCLCVLGFRATRTHTHVKGEGGKPQRLYWFWIIKAAAWGEGVLHMHVCEVNAFSTFQHFPKNITTLAAGLLLLVYSPVTGLPFFTPSHCELCMAAIFTLSPQNDHAVTSGWIIGRDKDCMYSDWSSLTGNTTKPDLTHKVSIDRMCTGD